MYNHISSFLDNIYLGWTNRIYCFCLILFSSVLSHDTQSVYQLTYTIEVIVFTLITFNMIHSLCINLLILLRSLCLHWSHSTWYTVCVSTYLYYWGHCVYTDHIQDYFCVKFMHQYLSVLWYNNVQIKLHLC